MKDYLTVKTLYDWAVEHKATDYYLAFKHADEDGVVKGFAREVNIMFDKFYFSYENTEPAIWVDCGVGNFEYSENQMSTPFIKTNVEVQRTYGDGFTIQRLYEYACESGQEYSIICFSIDPLEGDYVIAGTYYQGVAAYEDNFTIIHNFEVSNNEYKNVVMLTGAMGSVYVG